jgi:uncharacterized protein (DUF305 family)
MNIEQITLVILLVLLISAIVTIIIVRTRSDHFSNPCTDYLTDDQFLEHMIPHHQVAVDMSDLLSPITKNPIMKHMCRKISWQQKYEISMMNSVIGKLPVILDDNSMNLNYEESKLRYYLPIESAARNGECNPLFFKPNDHMKHMEHMDVTDKTYLEHMIPHHQVAIDMCHRLLLHTQNTHMMALCYEIIREQQNEILQMNQMLKSWNTWQYNSLMI